MDAMTMTDAGLRVNGKAGDERSRSEAESWRWGVKRQGWFSVARMQRSEIREMQCHNLKP